MNEVPFPSFDYAPQCSDLWTDIAAYEVPEYLKGLAEKYNMHFQVISPTENAMFNEKCCIIFGIDRRDGVILNLTLFDNGRRVEYIANHFIFKAFDDSDWEGIDPEWKRTSEKIRKELTVISRGLDSKWKGLLTGDMSWYEEFKKITWIQEFKCYHQPRNTILDAIIAWQQYRQNGSS